MDAPRGAALWPARFLAESVPSVERGEISSRAFQSLYQQQLVPAAGNLFKADYFENRYDPAHRDSGARITVMAIDCASSTGIQSDFSVMAVWSSDGRTFDLEDVWRHRCEFPELVAGVVSMAKRHCPTRIIVEQASAGLPLLQGLRRATNLPLVGIVPLGTKVARAEGTLHWFESLQVRLPRYAPWLDNYVSEMIAFPSGRHDDQVDSSVYGIRSLAELLVLRKRIYSAERQGTAMEHIWNQRYMR